MNLQKWAKENSPYKGKVTKVKDKGVFIVVTQEVTGVKSVRRKSPVVTMAFALTPRGDYIEGYQKARQLVERYGILIFEKRTEESEACSIGYNPYTEMWYGWSSRVIYGFSQPQAKKKAKRFAASVS